MTTATSQGVGRDHGFHELRIKAVIRETADAASFVLDVPPELADTYQYVPGQFCTFRASVGGEQHLRCYSMSSSPDVGDELQVTVKRVPGGVVSNWMHDELTPGDVIEATPPAGVFTLPQQHADVLGFTGGSGITPVFSIVKTVLATTDRRVRLLYANRDDASVIFAAELRELGEQHGDRVEVVHHLDADQGFVDEGTVRAFLGDDVGAECFVCGPGPFMDIVERALHDGGVPDERIHIERFIPAAPVEPPEVAAAEAAAGPAVVTIELDGRTETADHHPGTTILQTARQMGMSPPFSCESGSCATCMGRLVDGTVSMFVNNALTEEEVEEGFVLTCQSVPTSSTVHVVYGFD